MSIKLSIFFVNVLLYWNFSDASSQMDESKPYDPRSELYRNKTSGEVAWLESLETDDDNALIDDTRIDHDGSKTDQSPPTSKARSSTINSIYENRLENKNKDLADALTREIHYLSQPHGLDNKSDVDRATVANLLNYVHEDHEGSLSSLNTALYFLGMFSYYGLGGLNEADPLKAIQWLQQAAENGHGDSQCVLGLILYFGVKDKIGKDRRSAMRWFYRASQDADHPRGHWLLGKAIFEGMFYDDIGLNSDVPKQNHNEQEESNENRNFIEAARLFLKAAKHDIPEAIHQLAVMYEYGLLNFDADLKSPIETKGRFRLAVEYYKKAASLDLVESIYHLGLVFAYGRGVQLNYTIAADYFRQGAMKQHSPSMRYLAVFALNGYDQPNGKSNPRLAMKWFDLCVKSSSKERPDMERLCASELEEAKLVIADIRVHKIQAINTKNMTTLLNNNERNREKSIQYQ